jgi:hypothetical protein
MWELGVEHRVAAHLADLWCVKMTFNNTTIATELYPVANGITSSSPFVVIFQNRDPTVNDVPYPIQKMWLNTTTDNFWFLKNFNAANGITTANWIPISSSAVIELLQGNSGGPVPPNSSNIINVVGDGIYITAVGNPATSTLTIEPAGGLTTLYTENTGTATPMAGNLNVFGTNGINTAGSGNTITISGIGIAFNYTNVTHAESPYTILSTDYYISVDCSGGAVQLNFPNAPTFKQLWIVKDRTGSAATSNITLTTPGGAVTFDGLTTYTMNSNYQAINLLANSAPTYEVY